MLISNKQNVVKKDTSLASLLKFLLVLLMIYEGWYLEKYQAIPWLLQGLALAIIAITGLLLLNDESAGKNKIIGYWVFFGVYSVFAAVFVNADFSITMDALITYFAFIAVVFCAGVASKYTSSYKWFSNTVLFICILSAYFAIFHGFEYENGPYFVTTMSEFNNPNNLGLMMSIGTFVAVFPEHKPKFWGWVVRIFFSLVFLMVTVNTGSRSSVLCEVAVIVLFLYSQLKNMRGKSIDRLVKQILLIVGTLCIAILVFNAINSNNTSESGIRRLVDKFNEDSFSGRTDLYDLAWIMYKENPVFGIGYNNFATASGYGYFTHSTYMELLACTGTIGFVLFLFPVFSSAWRGLRSMKKDGGRSATILLMMLVSGFFGIVYYNVIFLMIMYMEISRIPESDKTM